MRFSDRLLRAKPLTWEWIWTRIVVYACAAIVGGVGFIVWAFAMWVVRS